MRCCQHHWDAVQNIVKMAGVEHMDTKETAPRKPYDAIKCSALCVKCTPEFRPMLAAIATLYADAIEAYGAGIMAGRHVNDHICPLCFDRSEFNRHLAGECHDPNCQAPKVTAESEPWDIETLNQLAVGLLSHAREKGAIPPLQ